MTAVRRRSFFLIEALIASSLTLVIVFSCLSIFVFLWKTSIRQQTNLTEESLRWRRISTLRWTLSRIRRDCKEDPFVLENAGGNNSRLIFVFDHGIHINPKLSNNDLAQLYIDQQKGLVLVTRSHPKREAIGQEEEVSSVIWPEARMITWRFALCAKDKTDKTGIEECQQDEWVTAWRPEWAGLPAVIQAVVRDDSGSETVVTAVVVQDIGAIILK